MKSFSKNFSQLLESMKVIHEEDRLPYSTETLLVFSKSINPVQMQVIEEAVLKKLPVTVVTSQDMSSRVKSEMLQLLTEYSDNSFRDDLKIIRAVRIFGYCVIVLGLMALGVFGYFHQTGNPIIEDSSLIAFFLPLLISYLGFLLVDWMDKLQVRQLKLRPNLELNILKPRHFKNKESVFILDSQKGYVESKKTLQQVELSKEVQEQLVNLIIQAREMGKKDRLLAEKNAIWLLES